MSVLSVRAKLQIEKVNGNKKTNHVVWSKLFYKRLQSFLSFPWLKKKPRNKQFLINDDDIEMVQSCCFFFTSLSFTFIVVSSSEELHVSPLVKPAHPERRLSARPLFAGSSLIWHLQILTMLRFISKQTFFNL